jgi:hypothetical protein
VSQLVKLMHALSKQQFLGHQATTPLDTGNQSTPLAIHHHNSRTWKGRRATHPSTGQTTSAQTIQSQEFRQPTRRRPWSAHSLNTSGDDRRRESTLPGIPPGNSQAQPVASPTPSLSKLIAQHGRGTFSSQPQLQLLQITPMQSNLLLRHKS